METRCPIELFRQLLGNSEYYCPLLSSVFDPPHEILSQFSTSPLLALQGARQRTCPFPNHSNPRHATLAHATAQDTQLDSPGANQPRSKTRTWRVWWYVFYLFFSSTSVCDHSIDNASSVDSTPRFPVPMHQHLLALQLKPDLLECQIGVR